MSNQKHHEYMKNLDRCYDAVLQSCTKGISAVEIAKKLGMHKTMVHRNLNSLELLGKVEDQHGLWRAKAGEQTIKPSEKEIVIVLPMPKSEYRRIAFLEAQAKEFERIKFPVAEDIRILLEKFYETRTIKIKGKNVDDLDLERLGNLIQQANEKSTKVSLKGLLKGFKRSRASNSKVE